MRRSTVLNLPLQSVFLGEAIIVHCCIKVKKSLRALQKNLRKKIVQNFKRLDLTDVTYTSLACHAITYVIIQSHIITHNSGKMPHNDTKCHTATYNVNTITYNLTIFHVT